MEGITWPTEWPEDPRPDLALSTRDLLEPLAHTEGDFRRVRGDGAHGKLNA